ncbi:MAG: sigma-70 family RNA polymerase sigma factor [Clostridiaceae bacterium]
MKEGIAIENFNMAETAGKIKHYNEYGNTIMDKLIETYSPYIYKLCVKLCKSKFEAEDLFQNTWFKVYKNIDKYKKENKFENWIYSICLNCYRDSYSKEKMLHFKMKNIFLSTEEKENEINNYPDQHITIEEDLIKSDRNKKVMESVNKLNDKYRIPILLFYFKDLTYTDISDILNIPTGTVKSRLYQGKILLKKLMEEYYGTY